MTDGKSVVTVPIAGNVPATGDSILFGSLKVVRVSGTRRPSDDDRIPRSAVFIAKLKVEPRVFATAMHLNKEGRLDYADPQEVSRRSDISKGCDILTEEGSNTSGGLTTLQVKSCPNWTIATVVDGKRVPYNDSVRTTILRGVMQAVVSDTIQSDRASTVSLLGQGKTEFGGTIYRYATTAQNYRSEFPAVATSNHLPVVKLVDLPSFRTFESVTDTFPEDSVRFYVSLGREPSPVSDEPGFKIQQRAIEKRLSAATQNKNGCRINDSSFFVSTSNGAAVSSNIITFERTIRCSGVPTGVLSIRISLGATNSERLRENASTSTVEAVVEQYRPLIEVAHQSFSVEPK